MTKLPLLKPNQLTRILIKLGFKLIRQEGSHMFFEHPMEEQLLSPATQEKKYEEGYLIK